MIYLVIHIIISLIFALTRAVKNRVEGLCYGFICLFFPIGGYVISIFLMMKVSGSLFIAEDEFDDDLIQITERMHTQDVVAIEDFLTFGNSDEKRHKIIEVLKRDSSGYIDKLKIALSDEDSETAHYAASAISEYKRQIDLKLQQFAVEYHKNVKDQSIIDGYIEVLNSYIQSGLLDKQSIQQYQKMLLDVLIHGIDQSPKYYEALIDIQLELSFYEEANHSSSIFLRDYESEPAYLSRLKYLYMVQDKDEFDMVFNALRNSELNLSNKALNVIRFWMKEVVYV